MQSTTLLNGLQRENSAKDALVHQAKRETEKRKKRIQQFPPCRRRLDIIYEANVALTSKIILIVACEYSYLSTLPLRWEVSKGALSYVEKPLASSPFLEGTKPASRDSRLHQMAMESLFAGYDEKRLLFPRYTFGCIEGSQ